ncbi:MAG TPA: PAS domain-containing protein [Anaerolineales bacterium]
MSMKTLPHQLETLFLGLDQVEFAWSFSPQVLPGWTWESDERGCFTSCSPEVEAVLGLQPQDFIGKSVTGFGLALASANAMESAFKTGQFPAELALHYRACSGELIAVTMVICATFSKEGEPKGWHGFATQQPCAQQARGGSRSSKRLAIERIVRLLEDVRRKTPAIAGSAFSRIHHEERSYQQPQPTEAAARTNHGSQAPERDEKNLVTEIAFKLEWGEKQDFTGAEKSFIEENPFAPHGLKGYIKRRTAPREILKCDLSWFGVFIIAEPGHAPYIWVSYPRAITSAKSMSLNSFLDHPELIKPVLKQAVSNPWISRIIYQIGEDYLVTP